MQTNAPASMEWVDQFNRAVAFGQINFDPKPNYYRIDNFNLLGNLNSNATFLVVPFGYRFVVSELIVVITGVSTAGGTVTTQPGFRVIRGSDSSTMNNPLTLRTTTYALNEVDKQTSFTSTNISALSGDSVKLNISTAIVQSSPTPKYNSLTGSFILSGYLLTV